MQSSNFISEIDNNLDHSNGISSNIQVIVHLLNKSHVVGCFFGRVCICLWVISCRLMTIKAILLPSLLYLTNGHSGNEKSLLQFSHFCFYIYFISISGTIMTLYYLKSTPHDFLVAIKSRRHIYSIYAFIFCSRFKYTWNIC